VPNHRTKKEWYLCEVITDGVVEAARQQTKWNAVGAVFTSSQRGRGENEEKKKGNSKRVSRLSEKRRRKGRPRKLETGGTRRKEKERKGESGCPRRGGTLQWREKFHLPKTASSNAIQRRVEKEEDLAGLLKFREKKDLERRVHFCPF